MTYFISELWIFTLNPKKSYPAKFLSTKSKFLDVFNAIIWYFILAIIAFIPILGLIKVIHHFFSIDILKIRDDHMKKAINGSHILLISALIGPIVEEVLFRLWLTFKKTKIAISLIAICLVLIIKFNSPYLYTVKINKEFCYYLIGALISGFTLFGLFNLSFFKNLSNKYFKVIYWASCIGFGLTHLVNFAPLKLSLIWAYPFFVLPQILLGFVLGFIRIKNGFFWALLIHCLINLFLELMAFK
ncbi:MAG: family intrarane metalloprotease [Mucilaginibacter sp.]|nr:family intrarane metalloprotease [Mucilaginibacter sp.]